MAILGRAMKNTGLNITMTDSEISSLLDNYSDGNSASAYAKTSVAGCLKTGIVKGSSETTLSLKSNITRAEVAVMIKRLLQMSELI